MQDVTAFFENPVSSLLLILLIHQTAQICLFLYKGGPGLLRPFPKAFVKMGTGQAAAACLDHLHSILVTGPGFQCILKIMQGQPLLIQVIISVGYPEIPAVISLKIFLIRF